MGSVMDKVKSKLERVLNIFMHYVRNRYVYVLTNFLSFPTFFLVFKNAFSFEVHGFTT